MSAAERPLPTDDAGSTTVEHVLNAAHRELAELQTMSRTLSRHGLAASALPHTDTMMAMALLGDHGRTQVIADLSGQWADLQEKGLVHGDIHAHSTPRLRLLHLVQPASESLAGVRTRLASGPAQPAPPEVFRCAATVRDLMWGQLVRLDYQINGADYLLIQPDRSFRRVPALIDTRGGAGHGNIELPGEAGEVVFSILGSDGEVYRHTTVFELRDADWLGRSEA